MAAAMGINCKKQRCVTRFGSVIAVSFCAMVFGACSPKTPKGLRAGEEAQVVAVRDDGALALAGGTVARLAAIDIPLPEPLQSPGPAEKIQKRKPPLFRALLTDAAMGRTARLYYGGVERDLHGAALAQIYAKDEAGGWIWLQERMVREGAARVRPTPNDGAVAEDLLKMESDARAAQKGLWADAKFAVRRADPVALAQDLGAFVLVEGKVANTDRNANRVFLNFGGDYKSDFTVSIPEEAWPAWPGGAPALLALKGENVRVRGVIEQRNGPSLELSHPAQLELTTNQK